jgi:hypothetical protein
MTILTLGGLLLFTTTAAAKKPVAPPLQWYVKTSVELSHPDSGLLIRDSRSGVFGQLAASEPGWDPHDIPAFGATQYANAAVVFMHGEDWEDRAGEYLSDYRKAGTSKDAWEFTVHSALGPDEVTLRWDGLFKVTSTIVDDLVSFTEERFDNHDQLKNLHLVDLTTGQVVHVFIKGTKRKIDQWTRSYSFDMGGAKRRDFRWVLGDVEAHHLVPFSEPESALSATQSGENSRLSSLQIQQLNAAQQGQSDDKFGTPPEIRN